MPFLSKKNKKSKQIITVGNTHHIGMRENQQDCFVISDVSNADLIERKGVFGIVADGMGGLENGSEVSNIVARAMLQYFNEVEFSVNFELDLLNMLFVANDNVNNFMEGREKSGSTAVAVIIHDGKLFWVSVGDSRIYLLRGGALIQINREHTYGVELDEMAAAGEIPWEDAANDPKRAALTSYIGMGKLEKVDRSIRPIQLVSGDRVLLMSDGVFGVLSDDEILSAQAHKPFKSAQELQNMVLGKQNPSQDNFTAIIFEYRSV